MSVVRFCVPKDVAVLSLPNKCSVIYDPHATFEYTEPIRSQPSPGKQSDKKS